MARVRHAPATKRRHKKFMKMAKGQYGARSKHYRVARESVMKGLMYATAGRKIKKRDFRRLWIARINAACRHYKMSYGAFINGLKQAKVMLNRKVLADLALNHGKIFKELVTVAKGK